MKKWEKIYLLISGIELVVAFIVKAVLLYFQSIIAETILTILNGVITLAVGLGLLAMLLFVVLRGIMIIKVGVHNLKECDDELFREIDIYKKCWKETNVFYKRQIQIIKFFYGKNGRVTELVKDMDVERLFARMDYLSSQNLLYENMITYYYSLAISVIASFLCQMMEEDNIFIMYGWSAVIIISFFVVVFSRYIERGQAGSYRYMINDYEKELLTQKIKEIEAEIEVTIDDKDVLRTQQIAINELLKLGKKAKRRKVKKQIAEDIMCVENLNMQVKNYNLAQKEKVFINGIECHLLYKVEEGKIHNYFGDSYLINKDYSIFVEKLNKYNLISWEKHEN